MQVKLKAAYHLCGPRGFQQVGAIALVALCQLNESVFKSAEAVNESVELGYKTMTSFSNRLRGEPRSIMEAAKAQQQMEEMGTGIRTMGAVVNKVDGVLTKVDAGVTEIGAGVKDILQRVKNLEGEVSGPYVAQIRQR